MVEHGISLILREPLALFHLIWVPDFKLKGIVSRDFRGPRILFRNTLSFPSDAAWCYFFRTSILKQYFNQNGAYLTGTFFAHWVFCNNTRLKLGLKLHCLILTCLKCYLYWCDFAQVTQRSWRSLAAIWDQTAGLRSVYVYHRRRIYIQKRRQRSLLLLGGQNLLNSLSGWLFRTRTIWRMGWISSYSRMISS